MLERILVKAEHLAEHADEIDEIRETLEEALALMDSIKSKGILEVFCKVETTRSKFEELRDRINRAIQRLNLATGVEANSIARAQVSRRRARAVVGAGRNTVGAGDGAPRPSPDALGGAVEVDGAPETRRRGPRRPARRPAPTRARSADLLLPSPPSPRPPSQFRQAKELNRIVNDMGGPQAVMDDPEKLRQVQERMSAAEKVLIAQMQAQRVELKGVKAAVKTAVTAIGTVSAGRGAGV